MTVRIKVLPNQVANQITAGEVIERPAAVVKELIENSIDAGASKVVIDFKNGGKTYIRVQDNGQGMSKEDLKLCLERHATSKICSIKDLDSICTFGFRGEAVPSIASISLFTIKTRRLEDVEGTMIRMNAGKLFEQKECGVPVGTSVEVEHLFNSVPGRKAFLKTDNTEASHIIHLCKLYAIAFKEISFEVNEDGQCVFRSPKCKSVQERVREIWGGQLADELIEVPVLEKNGLRIWGVIGRPGVSRSTKLEIITIVNNRPIESKLLYGSLLESYHTYIPKGRYPVGFMFFEMDPGMIDVNIHPAKREIKFKNEPMVRSVVIEHVITTLQDSIREALKSPLFDKIVVPLKGQVGSVVGGSNIGKEGMVGVGKEDLRSRKCEKGGEFKGFMKEEEQERKGDVVTIRAGEGNQKIPEPMVTPVTHPIMSSLELSMLEVNDFSKRRVDEGVRRDKEKLKLSGWEYMGGVGKGLFILKADSGVVILNLMTAQKRIFYEEIVKSFKEGEGSRQLLLIPIVIELSVLLGGVLEEKRGVLSRVGFDIEEFGPNCYRIISIPSWGERGVDLKQFIKDYLESVRGEVSRNDMDEEEMVKKIAKIGLRNVSFGIKSDYGEVEVFRVLGELLSCGNPLVCPEGRATFIEWSYGDLEKKFK